MIRHQPQPPALGLFGRDLQPLAPPDPLDPLIVDQPAGPAQQLGDLAIAVAAILPDQLDDVGRQPCLVVSTVRDLALRRAMLTECRAGTTPGEHKPAFQTHGAGASPRRPQKFPRDASCNISLSSVRS